MMGVSVSFFRRVIFIHATRQRWRLVDPPESWWMFSSQATVKKLCGSKVAIAQSYLTGGGFINSRRCCLMSWTDEIVSQKRLITMLLQSLLALSKRAGLAWSALRRSDERCVIVRTPAMLPPNL